MSNQINTQIILKFFLTRIIIGILVVGGLVAFIEWSGRLLLSAAYAFTRSLWFAKRKNNFIKLSWEKSTDAIIVNAHTL
jgi:hypothetical protein